MNRIVIKVISLTALLTCLYFFSFSQNEDRAEFEPNQVIVQLNKEVNIDAFVNRFGVIKDIRTGFKAERLLVRHMNVWLFSYTEESIPEYNMLEYIKQDYDVLEAQLNHKISFRSTTPNDPLFGNQWQYINDGINGITPDADIDADEAWDITTGGVTALGDTIVVCVIDDGIDVNHSDFGNNLWFNKFEIPNNNIDDDNNGFVDDYLGWNVEQQNDNISQDGSHGTAVAGIVGAKGNNGIGVTGVNWNVKLMIVALFSTDEAEVLEAYSYPLDMRRRYDKSGGSDGAYVVATNSSWGINFGQPANSPLWCAMYDTLGLNGILNCGATINSGQNVDVVGDLPTACPSDYLISVTNMNSADQKVNGAGFGVNTIDIGAHGANTYTVDDNNTYGQFGGTSGATPHVTGAIALLHSVQCAGFSFFAKAQPDSAALLMKRFILEGVDTLPSLAGLIKTEGRLNLYKSILKLQKFDCSIPDCYPSFSLQADSISDTSATLRWTALDSATNFVIAYGLEGDTIWDTLNSVNRSINIQNLDACTEYEFAIFTECDTLKANPSFGNFKTDGCCTAPDNLSIDSVIDNQVLISWGNIVASELYTLRYRIDGTSEWDSINRLDSIAYWIDDLDSCTDYEFQVSTVCADSSSTFTSSIFGSTLACIGCRSTFCQCEGDQTTDEWIQEVNIGNGTLLNNSGNDGGYADFTGTEYEFYIDSIYSIYLEPGYSFMAFDEYWKIWIDLNQDGDFDDPLENIFDPGSVFPNAVTGFFRLPVGTKIGTSRMRIAMRFNTVPNSCGNFDFGEVEDYCIKVMEKEPASIGGPEQEIQFQIVPNPSNGLFNILVGNSNQKELKLELYSNLGQLILEETITDRNINYQIDLSNFPSGVYLLRSNLDNESSIHKLIKE